VSEGGKGNATWGFGDLGGEQTDFVVTLKGPKLFLGGERKETGVEKVRWEQR